MNKVSMVEPCIPSLLWLDLYNYTMHIHELLTTFTPFQVLLCGNGPLYVKLTAACVKISPTPIYIDLT